MDIFFDITESPDYIKIKTKNVVGVKYKKNTDNIKAFCSCLLDNYKNIKFDKTRYVLIFSLCKKDADKGDYDNLNLKLLQDLIVSTYLCDDDKPQLLDVLFTINNGDTSDIYISQSQNFIKILKT